MRPAVRGTRRRIDSAVALLPQPDSPTRPMVLPLGMAKEMPSTARKGPKRAVSENAELARGVNIWRGRVVYPAVAAAVGETPLPLAELR